MRLVTYTSRDNRRAGLPTQLGLKPHVPGAGALLMPQTYRAYA
jgi:hypothetical protein